MNHFIAQNLTLPGATPIKGPLKADVTLGSVLFDIYKFVLPIAGIALLIMIVGAGFTLLTSSGDTKKMEQGKQKLTYAIIGFIVIFAAFWITQLLGITLGLDAIKTTFK